MQNYSLIQKLLHDFVLSKKIINKSLFEFEKIFFLKNKNTKNQDHVFITGMPRAGTTSLLNFLYSTNHYASLTYRDIPFVMSPHFSKIFSKKNIIKKERLHEDGIAFDLDSPEAIDEIFFSYNEGFIKKELINYIKLILLSYNKDRYLSKNNYNFKRIDLICEILPNSKFLILIREPFHHSNSLLKQHIHFSKLQKENSFIRRYMNYLGHNEFGLDHKPWNDTENFNNYESINYWLEQWNLFYQKILDKFKNYDNCYFLIYEQLTDSQYLKKLLEKINFNAVDDIDWDFFKNSNRSIINTDFSHSIYKRSNEIYLNFKDLSLK